MVTIMTEQKKQRCQEKTKMRYFLRHITQLPLPAALLLLVGALAMWSVDYARVPEQWFATLTAQSLTLISGVLLCMVLYRAKATPHFSLLPAILYVAAVGVLPSLRQHWQPQLISLVLLFFLYMTRDMSDSHEPNGLVFSVSLMLCLAALIVPDAVWCIVLLWIVVFLQGAFTFRTILASLLAVVLVAVYYVLAMYIGWTDVWDYNALLDRQWVGDIEPTAVTVTLIVMIATFLVVTGGAFRRSSYDLVSTRMLFYHVVLLGLLSAPLILFMTPRPDSLVLLPTALAATTGIFVLQKSDEARGVALIIYLPTALTLYLVLVITL